jgi:hypothetical protein
MCEIREEAKTKADLIIQAMDRLSSALERLITDPREGALEGHAGSFSSLASADTGLRARQITRGSIYPGRSVSTLLGGPGLSRLIQEDRRAVLAFVPPLAFPPGLLLVRKKMSPSTPKSVSFPSPFARAPYK